MYARVATFEGGDPEQIDQAVDQMRGEPGPPEGVPGKRVEVLFDRESRKVLVIGFFETEEDLRTGDEALSRMDPGTTMGERTSVGMYELVLEASAPS